jgi:hypothetical protein
MVSYCFIDFVPSYAARYIFELRMLNCSLLIMCQIPFWNFVNVFYRLFKKTLLFKHSVDTRPSAWFARGSDVMMFSPQCFFFSPLVENTVEAIFFTIHEYNYVGTYNKCYGSTGTDAAESSDHRLGVLGFFFFRAFFRRSVGSGKDYKVGVCTVHLDILLVSNTAVKTDTFVTTTTHYPHYKHHPGGKDQPHHYHQPFHDC